MKKRFLATLTAIALSVAGLTTTVAPSITAYAAGGQEFKLSVKLKGCYIGEVNVARLFTYDDDLYIEGVYEEEGHTQYIVEKDSDPDNIIESLSVSDPIEGYDMSSYNYCYIKIRDDANPNSTATLRVTSTNHNGSIVYATKTVDIKLIDSWTFSFSEEKLNFSEGTVEEKTITAKTNRKTSNNISYEWKIGSVAGIDIGDEPERLFELSGVNTPSVTVKYKGGRRPRENTYYSLSLEVKVDGEIVNMYCENATISILPSKDSTVPSTDNSKEIDNSKSANNKATQTPASQETPVLKAGEKVTVKTGESLKASKDGKSVVITKTSGKKSVKVPDKVVVNGVEYPVTELGKKAITGKKVKNVTINATNLTKINAKAFLGAKNLKTVKIVGVSKNSSIAKKIIKAAKKANKNVKIVFSK